MHPEHAFSNCFGLCQASTGVDPELGWKIFCKGIMGQCQVSAPGLGLRYRTGAGNQSPVRCQTLQLAKGSESPRC